MHLGCGSLSIQQGKVMGSKEIGMLMKEEIL